MIGFNPKTIDIIKSEIASHKKRINELKFLCNEPNIKLYKVLKEDNHLDLNQKEIVARTGVKQPNVAALLRTLREMNLIQIYRVGGNNKSNFYKLDEDRLDELYNQILNK